MIKPHSLNYIDDIKEHLLQVYIKNRTNDLAPKTFIQVVVNLRQLEGRNNTEILAIIKQLVKK